MFLRDTVAGTTTLVSINRSNNGSGADPSFGPSLSANGRRVAFTSYADDLVSLNTTNADTDVFIRDLDANITSLISVNCPGIASGNQGSSNPILSGDGNSVFFQSQAGDLIGGDFTSGGFGVSQIFRRDLTVGITELLSYNLARAGGGNGYSFDPAPSFNGSTVAFLSEADDLAAMDDNSTTDVFAWSSTFAPPEPRPALTITRQGVNQVTLSWPSPSTGFNLESTGNLNSPIVWTPVNATVTDSGLLKSVTLFINLNTEARFFRLKK